MCPRVSTDVLEPVSFSAALAALLFQSFGYLDMDITSAEEFDKDCLKIFKKLSQLASQHDRPVFAAFISRNGSSHVVIHKCENFSEVSLLILHFSSLTAVDLHCNVECLEQTGQQALTTWILTAPSSGIARCCAIRGINGHITETRFPMPS